MTDESVYVPKTMQADTFVRNVRLKKDGGRTSFAMSISRASPIDRGAYREGLDHSPGAVRMERFEAGAVPLLFNHNWNDPRGMITAGRVVDNDRIDVEGHFFDTPAGRDAAAMVDGGMHNVSFGYDVFEYEETAPNTLIARDWRPYEVSLAPVPADTRPGISRDKTEQTKPVRLVRANSEPAATAEPSKGSTMTDDAKTPAAGNTAADPKQDKVEITREAAPKFDPAEQERQRAESIKNLCRANKLDEAYAAEWINAGTSYNEIAKQILEIHQERGKSASAPAMLGLSKKETRQYSLLRAISAAANQKWDGAGLEYEAHRALMDRDNLQPRSAHSVYVPLEVQARKPVERGQTRDFTVAGAGNLVGTDHLAGSFIELLQNTSVAMRMGATRLTGLRGNVAIPKMTAGATAYWLASETTAITESQPTIGQVAMSPKNVAALTEISHQMLQQGDPSADQLVIAELARKVGLAADAGALSGDGTGGQPTGITNTGGVGTFAGLSLDYDAVLDAQVDLATANAFVGSEGYVFPPDVVKLLMTRVKFASTASPIWAGNLRETDDCAGFRGMMSNQVAAASGIFGAWASLIMAEWGVLELATDPNFNFATGSIGVRAWYTMDVGIRYAEAFSQTTGVT